MTLVLENEFIVCSAIHYLDGKEHVHQPKNIPNGYVVCGLRHHNCIQTSSIFGVRTSGAPSHIMGFITSKHRFVDRVEANTIAKKQNQIIRKSGNPNSKELYSEDIFT